MPEHFREIVIIIIILLSISLFATSWVAFKQKPKCPRPKCPEPEVNVSCPKDKYVCNPIIEPNITREINVELSYNNIQSTHHNLNYSLKDDSFRIDDIDEYGKPSGMSMQPTFFTDNLVMEKEYYGQGLQEGDIIRYDNGEGYTIHRIKGNYMDEGGYYWVQGDNNGYGDGEVYPENITHIIIGVLYT